MTSLDYGGNIDTVQFRMVTTACKINCHTQCKGKMARSKARCSCICHGEKGIII